MSFGYSIGDIVAIGQLCWSVYRACRGATGNYKDMTAELESLHINLKNLEEEAGNPKSLLNRRGEAMRDEFNHILDNIQKSLKDLEQMVLKYRSLGTMERRTWDRVRFGLKDLNTTRQKLAYHTAQIKLFSSNLMMDSLGRIESLLEEFILEIRSGKRARTILSIEQGADEAVVGWKQLQRDLSEAGVPSQDIERHRDDIEEYLAHLTMDLEIASRSPSLLGLPNVQEIPGDDWDSISQRIAGNENATVESEQSNNNKSNVISPIIETAENNPLEEASHGVDSETPVGNSIPIETTNLNTTSESSGEFNRYQHNVKENRISMVELGMNNKVTAKDDDKTSTIKSQSNIQSHMKSRISRKRKGHDVEDPRADVKLAAFEQEPGIAVNGKKRLKLRHAIGNEILKATSLRSSHQSDEPPQYTEPIRYSPTDFYTDVLRRHEVMAPSHRIVYNGRGEKLLAAGATWDYIISHPFYREGKVDIGNISERLKRVAKCDGAGPVFEEGAILDAIEKSVSWGGDYML